MRKINKLLITIILIAIMLLGIGYSAIQNITLDIEGTATAKATIYSAKTLPAKAYGGYVSNYVPTNGSSVGWRIFHSDGENIYLIADDYIERTYVPTDPNGKVLIEEGSTNWQFGFTCKEYDYFSGINTDIKNKWLKQYVESGYADTISNMGATAFLLETSLWLGFKDSNGYAQYAVGTPTLELFAESYNRTHPDNIIETQIENEKGYQVKWSEDDTYSYKVSNLDTSNNLYVITDNTKARACWIASPCSGNLYSNEFGDGRNIFNVRYNVALQYEAYYTTTRGVRPIIMLDSGIELHWQGDDQYLIVK